MRLGDFFIGKESLQHAQSIKRTPKKEMNRPTDCRSDNKFTPYDGTYIVPSMGIYIIFIYYSVVGTCEYEH